MSDNTQKRVSAEDFFKIDHNKPLMSIKDLNVSFWSGNGKNKREIKAVKNVSFDIMPGEKVAIVGESGSGKSTTAHALIGLLPGTGKVKSGSVLWQGHSDLHSNNHEPIELVGLSKKDDIKLRGSGIGLVPQDPLSNLNPVWKIGFQVEEALRANNANNPITGKKLDRKGIKHRVIELLEEAGLEDAKYKVKMYPHEFSGGMRQRVLIAIGMANYPHLLIADEPTSALDVTVQKVILDHIDKLSSENGNATLFITHDLGLAAERSDKLIVMYKGEIVESGASLDVLKNPQHPYTKRLIDAAPSLASQRLESSKVLVHHRQFENENTSVLTVRNLTKEFKTRGNVISSKTNFRAVDNISFDLPRGGTTAVVGESGSGKSTVANMCLGLLKPTSGDIYFSGRVNSKGEKLEGDISDLIKKHDTAKRFRLRVQPVFQNPYGSLDPMFSIGRAIREPLDVHRVGTKAERENRVNELLDLVQMPNRVKTRYPNELSGGQRQRIAIARALALKPELLVLDEAVSALDVLVQQQILELLNDLQKEFNLTFLFITHDLAVVRLVADHVIVMQNGKIVESGLTDDIYNSPSDDYTKNLLDSIPGRHII